MSTPSNPLSSPPRPHSANEVRNAFRDFFIAKGHAQVESASLIPHDPTVLFTVAGMVPFKPYFVGDETPPYKRAVSVQKCARAGGKHNDLDDVGRTKRHLVFFEMLGNFSFGDYFKESAIPWSWELVTEVFGFDGDQLWITVHESDDEAEAIWHEQVGVPMSRIQRLGDKDNFWQMGDTGPCGPCSEIHIDRGPAFGPDGGPLNDPFGDRFLEFWNLVFMQYNQAPDGSRTPLPKPSIDTGAGLERIVALMQKTNSVWETDLLMPLVEQAQSLTGKKYLTGDYDDKSSFSLRVLAEHARSSTMLVNDGVFPSNENRGYVLRRIIRRAVRHAYILGTEKLVMPSLVNTAIDGMGAAYPDVQKNRDFIVDVLTREEEKFRQTLKTGTHILDEALDKSGKNLAGSTAFLLHDTYGFPLELTQEIASEREVEVDLDGFRVEMNQQRDRAKQARKGGKVDDSQIATYRNIMETHGVSTFVGYESVESSSKIVGLNESIVHDGCFEVFLDVTPFYAESGGQVGDTGTITNAECELEVLDTTFALPNLRMHLCRVVRGIPKVNAQVVATINDARRTEIRRHHTATHMLHWALREVLGEHVKQAGSLVEPDRLRFDFSHYAAVSPEELQEIERIANLQVLKNCGVSVYETSKDEATKAGAIAFFGDKYGDLVRVLDAGDSVELCGGTHVGATGDIGAIKILSESSIGSNLRRIEAVAGTHSLAFIQQQNVTLSHAAELLGATPDTLNAYIERKIDDMRELQDENRVLRSRLAATQAVEIAETAVNGGVVQQIDGLTPGDLRELAIAIRNVSGIRAVVLAGVTDTGGVAIVAATTPSISISAGSLITAAAKAVGGGGGGKGDIATAGGKNTAGLPEAISLAGASVQEALGA